MLALEPNRAVVLAEPSASPVDGLVTGYSKFWAALPEGRDWKQGLAETLAGEYDRDAIKAGVMALKDSEPLVVFGGTTRQRPRRP